MKGLRGVRMSIERDEDDVGEKDDDEMDEKPSPKKEAYEAFVDAVRSKDTDAGMEALEAFLELCSAEKEY